jgi:KUP system potassium uptake protein
MLNYFGQGAILLRHPEKAPTLFFETVPAALVIPLVLLSCAATVIASQAMISGAFSLTRQAVQLGYSPRLEIRQTSSHTIGQVYVPLVNWGLLIGVLTLMFSFKTSGALAGAYGVAVASAMTITSLFFYHVARSCWGWPKFVAGLLLLFFLIPDLAFLYANLLKLPQGGWFPLVIATVLGVFLSTWKTGRTFLREKLGRESLPIELFLEEIGRTAPHRVDGTAVFLTGNPTGIPITLLHNYKHNKVLHDRILLVNVRNESVPRIDEEDRSHAVALGQGFFVVTVRYGFSESPNIPKVVQSLNVPGFEYNAMKITYFVGRETLVVTSKKVAGFPIWRKQLFLAMSRNAQDATRFFEIPPNRVIELGVQIEL